MSRTPPCILFIGPPGCGKSTQISRLLMDFHDMQIISPGEMLREEAEKGTALGDFIKANWNHNELSDVVENMMERVLARGSSHSGLLVIDGHPRNVGEVKRLYKLTVDRPVCVISFINCNEMAYLNTIKRKRNNEESVQSVDIRFKTYENTYVEVREKLLALRVLYEIDGNRSTFDVYADVRTAIELAKKKNVLVLPPSFFDWPNRGPTYVEPIERAVAIQYMIHMFPTTVRHWKHFVGRQAVSLLRSNVDGMKRDVQWVSKKFDGVRHMLLIGSRGEVYMVDRAMSVKRLIVRKGMPVSKSIFLTMVDVEWMEKQNIIIVIDCPYFHGHDVTRFPLSQRVFRGSIVALLLSGTLETLTVVPQMYFTGASVGLIRHFNEYLFKKVERGESRWPSDGFIFTPESAPYVEGTDPLLLKWKERDHVTVDFLYRDGDLLVLETKRQFGLYNQVLPQFISSWLKNESIIECRFSMGKWIPIRERNDRELPNPRAVVNNIMESFRENITEEEMSAIQLGYIKSPTPERSR